MMPVIIGAGLVATFASSALYMPPARELVIKLGTLIDMARRANPALFQTRLQPINPFVDGKFKMPRIAPVLRADLSEFGEIPQRLQRECKKLDRKAHIAMWPVLVYALGLGAWYLLR